MGGGDLNLKKSWHPSTLRNLEKVWKAERAAEKEQQQMDLLRKEKIQEQSLEDLKKLQEHKSAGKNRNMVDWIYSGSTSSATPVSEDYLLGKKKPLLFEPKAKPTSGTFMGALESKGLSGRDAEAKAREDPLLLIRKDDDFESSRTSVIPTKAKSKPEFQAYMLFEDNYDINLALAATSTKVIQSKYCPVLAPRDAVEYIRLRSNEVISQWI